jgi:PAS domain S-box-containing protein
MSTKPTKGTITMNSQNGNRILVIEDEDILAKVCVGHLQANGFDTGVASSGTEGLEKFNQDAQLAVVVTDVKLPDMSGLEILRSIKKSRPHTEVIVVTGFPNYDIAMNALKLGADDYLEKPFRLEVFQRTVEKALERYNLKLENQVYQQRLAELVQEKSQEVKAGLAQLESEHHELKSLIHGIDAGIFFTDHDNKVLEINEFARLVVGKPYHDIVGKPCGKDPVLKKMVKGARPIVSAHNLLESESSPPDICLNRRWFSVTVTPLTTHDNSAPTRNIYTFYDVTLRRLLERKIQKYAKALEHKVKQSAVETKKAMEFSALLLDAAQVFTFFITHDHRIPLWNKYAETLTGISASEADSLDVFHRLLPNCPPGTHVPFEPESLKHAETGKPFLTSLKTVRGDILTLSWTATPIPDCTEGRQGGFLLIGIDITHQKRLEDKLQQYNTRLEEMVQSRTAELRAKDAQLIHSSRLAALGEIAAGIAHEMKQPLNGISITADLLKLLQKKNELTEESLNSNVEMIKAMGDRMSNTVNHLRGFSYHGSNQFHPINISDAIHGAFSILGEQLYIHGIDVQLDIPDDLPPIMGDINQMEQVLINLLTNARDAMDKKEQKAQNDGLVHENWEKVLRIFIRPSADNSQLLIEVSDTGTGVQSKDIKHIFEPFYTTKEVGEGTGLGLSISQNIVQQHHGKISVDSQPNEGTTFRIELPTLSLRRAGMAALQ